MPIGQIVLIFIALMLSHYSATTHTRHPRNDLVLSSDLRHQTTRPPNDRSTYQRTLLQKCLTGRHPAINIEFRGSAQAAMK